jgi:hypothetical protein
MPILHRHCNRLGWVAVYAEWFCTSGRLDFHAQPVIPWYVPICYGQVAFTRIWFGGIVRTKNTKEEKVDKDVTGWIPSRLQAKEKRRGHFNI